MNIGLVQNGMLLGLLALAIPFIIHLLFRQKPREVQIGSVRFLREIMEKHRNRRRVMKWLLMSLRMLGIALLAILFARPFLTEKADGTKGQKLVVIMIDRSGSMQLRADGVRLVDTANEEARALIKSAAAKTEFEVAYFDYEVHPISLAKGGGQSELLEALVSPEASHSATDYAAAFRWAHDVCTTSTAETIELHVLTDLQQSGLAWSEVEPMPADVLVKVRDLGRDLPNNLAIVASTPKQLVVRPGESTSVEVSLLNAGPFPLEELPVTLDLKNGNRTIHKREKLKIESGSIETLTFELSELTEGLWQGTVTAEAIDDMTFDNQRHLAVMSATQYRVHVIDGEPNDIEEFSGTHYLRAALRLAPPGRTYTATPYAPNTTANGRPLSSFDVVVVSNAQQLPAREIAQLKEFVEGGGALLVFSGSNVNAEDYKEFAKSGLVPGEVIAPREAFDLPWRIGNWDEKHSIFEPFLDPQYGDLRKLAFRGITEMRVEESEDVHVVAKFTDDNPFVIEKQIGDAGGTVVWVNTSCDNQWSNWTDSEMYVPIVHQMFGYLTGLNAGGPVREELIDTTSEELSSLSPGIFPNGKSHRVVNVSPRESETDRCSIDDFVNRFELNTGGDAESQPEMQMASIGALDLRQMEIWHWILFALVTVFVAEFFLSNRTVA